jgi:hypothetical protein
MVNIVGSKDNYSRWKPKGFEKHLTMAELCTRVNRTRDRIEQLEKFGKLPSPVRVSVGALKVRLYSPKEVAKIEKHFREARPGAPKKRR